jgi:energy-coupling factor transporter transmembrane protein EcfT
VRFLGVTSAAFVVLVLFVSPFEGGVQWGPRFLLPIIVALAVIVVVHAWKLWNGWQRAGKFGVALVLAVLFMAGLYSTWNGVRTFVEARQGTADLTARILSLPERVVVADAWFIPQGVPYTLSDKLWFMAEDEKSMRSLLQMLRKTTSEASVVYLSSPYWAHVDPQIIMGPRLALIGDPPDTSQYVTIARYQLLR